MIRVLKVLVWVLSISVLLMLSLFWYLNTANGQKLLTESVNDYIKEKIDVAFSIGEIRYGLPDYLILNDVYLEDRNQKVLLKSGKIRVDMSMWALLRSIVDIDQVVVENTRLNVYRKTKQEDFNYQFLVDVFTGDSTAAKENTANADGAFSLSMVRAKNLELNYFDQRGGVNFKSKLKSASVSFSTINPSTNKYHVNNIDLNGGFAVAKTFAPLYPLVVSNEESESLDLDINGIKIQDFGWKLIGDDLGIDNTILFKDFETKFKSFDLESQKIEIDYFNLEKSKVVVALSPREVKKLETIPTETKPWTVGITDFLIDETQIKYDDNGTPVLAKGFDYNHIDFRKSKIEINELNYSEEAIYLEVKDVQFTDKSSLKIEKVAGNVSYTGKGIKIENLDLRTPFTKINSDAELTYNSLNDLTDNLNSVGLNLKINNSQIAFSDILLINPELETNLAFFDTKKEKVKLDVDIKGTLADLSINQLKVEGFQNSRINLSGRISRPDDFKFLKANLDIKEISTSDAFIKLFLKDEVILNTYNIPERLSLSGKVKGNASLLNVNVNLSTSLGDISIVGDMTDLSDPLKTGYEGKLHTVDLAVNKLFKQEQEIGLLSTDIFLKSNASFQDLAVSGQIHKLGYGDYTYQNLDIDGTLEDSVLNLKANSLDPNAILKTNIQVDLKNGKFPINGEIIIDKLNLAELKLADYKNEIEGIINLDMLSILPKELEGTFNVQKFAFGNLKIGEMTGVFLNQKGKHLAKLESPFFSANLEGEFDYVELPNILMQEANSYFEIDSTVRFDISGNQNFTLKTIAYEHPIWNILIPDLSFEKNININSTLNGRELTADMSFGALKYGDIALDDFQFAATGDGKVLKGKAHLSYLNTGSFAIPNNDFEIVLSNNVLDATLVSKDSLTNQKRHSLGMKVEKVAEDFKINLNEITLDKKTYAVNKTPIYYNTKGLRINGLSISNNSEEMEIDANNEVIDLKLSGININTLANSFGYREEEINGILTGHLKIKNYLGDYELTGSFAVNKFTIKGIEGGDLELNLEEIDASHVKLNGGLEGRDSRLDFNGTIGLADEAAIDFSVNIGKIDAKLIQSFSGGELKNSKGFIAGSMKITGTSEKPLVNGKLSFVDYNFTADYLGIPLKIENQQLFFKGNQISFENFILQDSLNQKMAVQGQINWADLNRIAYNLKLSTRNFLLLNTAKGSNELFYGKANVNANLDIVGVGENPSVSGKIRVNETSNMTFIMPSEIETAESNGVVTFVPPAKTKKELEAEEKKIVKTTPNKIAGLTSEIILEVETDPKAQLNIIMDELSGDNLKVNGTANLTVGIYPSGEIFALGIYEIGSGSYDFSFEFLRRNFQLQSGSSLIWSGDPYHASLQLKALYEVNADIQSLNKTFDTNFDGFGKVPIDVILNIEGTIQNPLITFDLKVSPKAESTIKAQLENNDVFATLRKQPSEMNQQVFSLLIFNKFLSAESINISSALNTQAIARQSVSKLLTEQLNVLAGDVLGSVGLNFGLNSDQLNTTDGNAYRTNLNVGLKKTFLNDRIKISVGKNFEIENSSGIDQNSAELLDNIEIGYNITADGRYVVKVYRNSQFQTVLEGFVLETGVSFVLSADYENMKDLFKNGKSLK